MNIYNVIILDESGSMSAIYNQALTGINEVLSGIRKTQEDFPDQHHYVTIVTFEGSGMAGIKTRRDRVAIEKIEDFGRKDYRPGGGTPLYDAMGKTLNELEGQIHEEDRVMPPSSPMARKTPPRNTPARPSRKWYPDYGKRAGPLPISAPTKMPWKWPGTCT